MRHDLLQHHAGHLAQLEVASRVKFMAAAVRAFVGSNILYFVQLEDLLGRAWMACLAGLGLRISLLFAGGASGLRLLLLLLARPCLPAPAMPRAVLMLSSRRRPRIMRGLGITEEGQLEFSDAVRRKSALL